MTWFQYHNYGSALQVSALYRVVSGLGYAVDVIDYRAHGKVATVPSRRPMSALLSKARRKATDRLTKKSFASPERERLFSSYLDRTLTLTKRCETMADLESLNEAYDTFVCGSDQIWAPSVFDPHYFLDFAGDGRLKVAYAPSVGLPEVSDGDVALRMGELASRIDCLSTREESGSAIIGELTGRDVATVLDPTLLVEADGWRELAGDALIAEGEPYLLVYMLGRDERQWVRIREIASALGLPIRVVPVFERDRGREGCISEAVGPREFVALIANAKYVCTDSFHGVAFSINLGREFCVFERFRKGDAVNQNSRIYNILKKTGLESRLATASAELDDLVMPIEWDGPKERLSREREASLSWLESALSSEPRKRARKDNVLRDRTLCCGCSACEAACPVGAIEIGLDEEGFWSARVDESACISCGKCRKVCPFIVRASEIAIGEGCLYSYKSGDPDRLRSSSSGGAAAALAERASSNGAAVLGCAFDVEEHGPKHCLVEPGDVAGLAALAGSKYMQSRMSPALARSEKYEGPLVVTGTPCQVAGARNLLSGRENVLYIDLICHGVPSRNLYMRYLDWLHRKHGLEPEGTRTEFRYKPRGWRERYIYSTDGEHEACLHQRRDPYFLLFEAGQCYAKCCYECPWRSASAADVRLGDYWGPRFEKDGTGVSMVLAMTERGREAIRALADSGELAEQPLVDYMRWQQTANLPEPVFRDRLLDILAKRDGSIEDVTDEFAEPVAKEKDIRRRLAPAVRLAKRSMGGGR